MNTLPAPYPHSTHTGAGGQEVFGNIASISDGDGYEHSTGVIYTFLPTLDATYHDLMADPRVSLTFSEKPLANGTSGGCAGSTAENPTCARLIVSGRLTLVPAANSSTAIKYLYARHPEMEDWAQGHHFLPFWLHPSNITDFFLIDMFGGAVHPTVAEYLAAPWQRNGTASGFVCSVCGHVYDPKADGGGLPFEKLPDSWTCPICGSPKSAVTLRESNSHASHPSRPAHRPHADRKLDSSPLAGSTRSRWSTGRPSGSTERRAAPRRGLQRARRQVQGVGDDLSARARVRAEAWSLV